MVNDVTMIEAGPMPDYREIDLASEQGIALLRSAADRYGEAIVQAAGIASRLFLLRSPWSPGLRFVGGQTKLEGSDDDPLQCDVPGRSVGELALDEGHEGRHHPVAQLGQGRTRAHVAGALELREALDAFADARDKRLLQRLARPAQAERLERISIDGRGLACGLASRTSLMAAARAAVLELCQMELAILLAQARLAEKGEASLTVADRQCLARATKLDANCCELLHPLGAPGLYEEPTDQSQLPAIARMLMQAGVEAALVDLTRPQNDIQVVRAVA